MEVLLLMSLPFILGKVYCHDRSHNCFCVQPEEAQQQGAAQLVKHITTSDGLPAGFLEELVTSTDAEVLVGMCESLGKELHITT